MTALGFSGRNVPLDNTVPGMRAVFNSDLAFEDDTVVQGTYAGFRLIDVTYPSRPKEDRQLDAVRQPDEHRRQPGRRDRLG